VWLFPILLLHPSWKGSPLKRTNLLLIGLLLLSLLALPGGGQAQAGGRFYRESGKTLAAQFISYFDAHGGLAVLGLPLSDAANENGLLTQYTERARLEYHPEAKPPYDVQLGLLGVALTAGREFARPASTITNTQATTYFAESGHTLRGKFRDYWQAHGGLAQFGFPLSEEFVEVSAADGKPYSVQYFERNRFEYHPENKPPYDVLLGLLGRDLLQERVTVTEELLTLPTYQYQQALYDQPGDSIAPYQRLHFDQVGPPLPQGYKLLTLENRYLKVSVLPELGGRVYGLLFKSTGHQQFYQNAVVKPSNFGQRGWWLGVGGIEWALPTEEHGYLENIAWDYAVQTTADGSASVRVTTTERTSGLRPAITISLRPLEAALRLHLELANPGPTPASYQFWLNAMLAPGGSNTVSPNTEFALPISLAVTHSTADSSLPPAQSRFSWPNYDGRDLSRYANWRDYLGFFAVETTADWAAVYNHDRQEGVVRVFPHQTAPGLKLFAFGPRFDPKIYTDDGSQYLELWGGVQATFWDSNRLAAGAKLAWDESWYPLLGTGAPRVATAAASLNLTLLDGNRLRIAIAASRPNLGGRLVLRNLTTGSTQEGRADVAPDKPLIAETPASPGSYSLDYYAADGLLLASWQGELR